MLQQLRPVSAQLIVLDYRQNYAIKLMQLTIMEVVKVRHHSLSLV